ncbi:MAG: hypothetical protein GY795_41330 [Desulfobacterales bacterium]|nr:hypothetical protein [Desulfobacterales bacterium]
MVKEKSERSLAACLSHSGEYSGTGGRSAKDKRSDLLQNGIMQKEKSERSLAACLSHS